MLFKDLSKEETVVSRISSPCMLVEESVDTFIHEQTISHLLPNVKPTNRRLVVPTVRVVKFNDHGKICSLNVYWDQASVLKQLGMLPITLFCKANNSETTLPVVGIKIADSILAGRDQVLEQSSADENTAPKAPATVSRKSSVSNLLSGQTQQEDNKVRSSTRVFSKPPSYNFMNSDEAPVIVHKKNPHFESQIALAVEDDNTVASSPLGAGSRPTSSKSRKQFANTGNVSHFSLNYEENEATTFHPQRKLGNHPTNESHFNIGTINNSNTDEELTPDVTHTQKRLSKKPSNESHFNIGVIHNSNTEEQDMPDYKHTQKKLGRNENASHWFGGMATADETKIASKAAMRDPNYSSIGSATMVSRPSSRVLGPPGGLSSITIG
jgi:hypothetical protein